MAQSQVKSPKELFENCLEQFPFDSTQKLMKFLKWKYWNTQVPPSMGELKETVRSLWKGVEEGIKDVKIKPEEPYVSSTGGFQVTAMKNKFNTIDFVKIEFIPYETMDYND